METRKPNESEEDKGDTPSDVPREPLIFHELNFFSLPSQSNIYGLIDVKLNDNNKLLVARLSGEIFRLEIDPLTLQTSWKSITFSYIPAEAEIISLDAFVREPNGLVVGVTLIKTTETKETYFNIYGLHIDSDSFMKWDAIAEDWTPINLKFVPLKLLHTQIYTGVDTWEMAFILSGDDLKIHLYRITCSDEVSLDEDPNVEKWFPEFQEIPSSITDISIVVCGQYRYTTFGCQNGFIKCCLVDISSNTILKSRSTSSLNGPITSVNLFPLPNKVTDDTPVHLLFTSALQYGGIYFDTFKTGMETQPVLLPSSDQFDCVTCSASGDINCDGQDELIIGTYGKSLLIYQMTQRGTLFEPQLIWRRGFAHSIHCVWVGDITGDGLNEIVVLSSGGVHILQHDLDQVHALCISRIKDLIT